MLTVSGLFSANNMYYSNGWISKGAVINDIATGTPGSDLFPSSVQPYDVSVLIYRNQT